MSFGQPNSISKADDSEVILPNNKSQVKVIRDKAVDGAGTYYGYLKSGVKEIIGGPGALAIGANHVWSITPSISLNATALFYSFFVGASSATEAERQYKYNGLPVTLSKFSLVVITNTSSTSSVYTVRINGVNTAITVTVPAGATGRFEDLVNIASVATGDLISIEETGITGGTVIINENTIIAKQ